MDKIIEPKRNGDRVTRGPGYDGFMGTVSNAGKKLFTVKWDNGDRPCRVVQPGVGYEVIYRVSGKTS
jgi:hypothetical protein